MSAAQTFRFSRQRRSRPIVAAAVLQPEITDSAPTITEMAGVATAPVQLTVRAERPAPVLDGPVLDRRSRPRNGRSVRRLNLVIAGVLLIVFAPLMLLIAIAVRLTSKGPIIYKQVRVGRDRRGYESMTPDERRDLKRRNNPASRGVRGVNGRLARELARKADADRRLYAQAVANERRNDRSTGVDSHAGAPRRNRIATAVHDRRTWNTCGETFTMFKFRTMCVDAETGTGAVWAQKHDPRVTPIGGFLRKCRLDELPQLINVLKGDMNIVGPRPERPTIVPDLVQSISYYPMRQRTRPGITGLAQISHSYDASLDDVKTKVRYDLEYLRRRSVLQDLRIMMQTPLVMFFKRSGQ